MKKILWLAHPLQFNEELCEFPAYLAKLINGEVTTVFIDAGIYENIPLRSNSSVFPTSEYKIGEIWLNDEKKELADMNRAQIRSYFSSRGLHVNTHANEGLSFEELIDLSKFYDLMVTQISMASIMSEKVRISPFVNKTLTRAQCPVLLMPDDHQTIDEIIFTYNGSYSSLYAIKQFTYLFESLHEVPVTVIYVAEEHSGTEIPNRKELIGYLSDHYAQFSFRILRGRPESELTTQLMYRKNAIVSFGAFGRNDLSRLLHPSNSQKPLEMIDLPVFITHP